MANLNYAQMPSLFLSGSGVIVGATSISTTTFSDIYGNVLTIADFGAKGYGTLEPDTTNEESFTFTGVTANANGTYTLTGVSTTLAKSPYTETSGLVRSHAGGTKAVISDTVPFWATFANKTNNEIITGSWTFNTAPVALGATPASTSTLGNVKLTSTPFTALGTMTVTIATPAVVSLTAHGLIAGDSVQFTTTGALPTGISLSTNYYVIATGLTANTFQFSTTTGGSAVNTTGSQSGVHTLNRTTPFAVGNDDPRVSYKIDTGAANAYVLTYTTTIPAYVAGQMYIFKATNANTTASTLNVNGLGVKTIKKGVSTDLASGDIAAGQIVEVIYDGTNMIVIGGLNASSTADIFTANGTWTKPGSAKLVRVILFGGGGSGASGVRSNVTITGAGAGGGGGVSIYDFIPSVLGVTETVTVATSTAGAVGVTGTVAANGNNGATGGTTSFGSWLKALGGTGGVQGNAGGAGGAGGAGLSFNGSTGGSGTSGAAGGNGTDSNVAPTGGGAGSGGVVAIAGGNGGALSGTVSVTRAGGVGGTQAVGASGTAAATNEPTGGTGGGGGGGASAGSSFSGGNGAIPGGGGGGGGVISAANGVSYTSGAGGNGGAGLAIVISYI